MRFIKCKAIGSPKPSLFRRAYAGTSSSVAVCWRRCLPPSRYTRLSLSLPRPVTARPPSWLRFWPDAPHIHLITATRDDPPWPWLACGREANLSNCACPIYVSLLGKPASFSTRNSIWRCRLATWPGSKSAPKVGRRNCACWPSRWSALFQPATAPPSSKIWPILSPVCRIFAPARGAGDGLSGRQFGVRRVSGALCARAGGKLAGRSLQGRGNLVRCVVLVWNKLPQFVLML